MPEHRDSGPDVPGPDVPVIHAVTDDTTVTRANFPERALGVMRSLGARGAVHLRARIVPAATLYAIAVALAEAQRETGCWLVLNDRVDIALAAGARGVQLTSRSMHVRDARAIAPALAVGASIHSAEEARDAEQAGATWMVAGHIFETSSHPGAAGRGELFVQAIAAAARLPCIVIGGVRPANVASLRAMGAYGVAAITGIWGAADAERAATDYLSAYDDNGGAHA
ncbi:MAG: thiamine phosphate synthase [Gemmatimonadaceae bacterium]